MRADTLNLTKVFFRPVKYQIPLFQRPYVWTQELQWEPLWEDVRALVDRQLDSADVDDDIPHFLGAIVLEQIPGPTGFLESRSVIDGQQRLTTLQLLLAAARSVALEQGVTRAGDLFGELIFNDEKLCAIPSDRFKVLPTEYDRPAFEAAVAGTPLTGKHEGQRVTHAYEFFQTSISEWVREDGSRAEVLLEALNKAAWQLVECVIIDLDREDNAQVIFETLNARGTPLLAADLVKNLLFQPASSREPVRHELYERYWKPLDSDHWRRDVRQGRLVRPRIDVFIMHWLTMTLRRDVVIHQLYPDFRAYLKRQEGGSDSVIARLAESAAVYDRFETYPHRSLEGQFFYRLGEMDTTTAFPVLLWMFGPEGLSEPDRTIAIRVIESWLVRRMVTRRTAKNYNNVFLGLLNRLTGGPRPAATVVDYFRGLDAEAAAWPDDEAFRDSLMNSPLYTVLVRRRLRMLLEAIEESLGTDLTEQVLRGQLTVEHVLPQQWRDHWALEAGEDAEERVARRDYLKHTLGNLSLITGKLNSTASNSGWVEKREYLNKHSVLLMSADVRTAETWTEEDIQRRTHRLAEAAIRIWPGPDSEVWGYPDAMPAREPLEDGSSTGDHVAPVLPVVAVAVSDDERPSSDEDAIPQPVRDLIQRRATERPDLPLEFAQLALSREGVHLRAQQSKNEATYFQVRSANVPFVLAYANVFARELKIDFRLPDTHEPYGLAKARPGNAYGLGIIVRDQGQLGHALRLLDDTLSMPADAPPPAPPWTEERWLDDLHSRGFGHLADAARQILTWARQNDVLVRYRASGKVGGIAFMPQAQPQAWLFSMWTNGTLIAENNHLKHAPAFSSPEQRRELLRRLNGLPGVTLNEANTSGYQRFPLETVADSLPEFLAVYRWVLDALGDEGGLRPDGASQA